MAIIRGPLSPDNYTIVPNEWLRDPRLSYKAKGILAYVMSHRADYELTVEQMVDQSSDGAAAIYSGLKELVEVGYLLRERRRNTDGTLGAVDYRVADVSTTTSQKSTSGKSRCGADQGKHDVRAGRTTSRKSRCGKSTSGKSSTKKEQPPTGVEEDHPLEDEKTPTPGPAQQAEPLPDLAQEGEGHSEDDQPQPDTVGAMVREAVAVRPDWSPRDVQRVVTEVAAERGDLDLVRIALLLAAHDPQTKVPRRLLHGACPHWASAARELQRMAAPPGRPDPDPPPSCPSGLCDGFGSFVQVVKRREVRGYKDGQPIIATVEDEVPTTCTACHAGYQQTVASAATRPDLHRLESHE